MSRKQRYTVAKCVKIEPHIQQWIEYEAALMGWSESKVIRTALSHYFASSHEEVSKKNQLEWERLQYRKRTEALLDVLVVTRAGGLNADVIRWKNLEAPNEN